MRDYLKNDFRSRIWRRKIETRNEFAKKLNELPADERKTLTEQYDAIFGIKKEYCLPL